MPDPMLNSFPTLSSLMLMIKAGIIITILQTWKPSVRRLKNFLNKDLNPESWA